MILVLLKVTLLLMCGLTGAHLARRARAATRHALLVAALAASMLVAIVAVMGPRVTVAVPMPARVAALSAPALDRVNSELSAPAGSGREGNGPTARQGAATAGFWTVERAIIGLWAVVACLVAAVPLRDLWLLRRLRRDGLPWTEAGDLARALALEAGVGRAVTLVIHEDLRSPLTMGWRRPTVLMPPDAAAWDEAALRRALIHEVEHVRRHDWPVQWLARAICVMLWFHPLAWAVFRRLALEAERACDDAVLALNEQTAYATQLVDLARRATGRQPAAGLTMAARGDLATRVSAILDPLQRRGRVGAGASAALAAAALCMAAAIAPLHAVVMSEAPATTAPQSDGRRGRGAMALMRAAERGDIQTVRALIGSGADVNAGIEGEGSPLIAAARGGSLEAVRLLLDAGADVNQSVSGDGNPLIAAASGGSAQIVAELLDRGAGINDVVPGDENPLIAASAAGRLLVARLLVSRGADVHARVWSGPLYSGDGEWRTPLGQARRHGHAQIAQLLMNAGARR